ncbi:thiolase family protein [Candidatus Palauibacter sp.]|uniref:thiolase family protein n=1 Tax=Candidatus Palauibacter sp. TaxID=3101350 RepID=UPI003AF2AC3C
MNDADRTPVIIDAVRTPVGRAGGALSSIRADDLLAHAIRALVERTGVPAGRVEDVVAGCTNQAGEDNRNVARMAGLLAGLPVEVGGQTVNRLCGSGVQAAATAANAIRAGEGDVFIAGGVESMSRAPWVMLKSDRAFSRVPPRVADTTVGWRFANPAMPERWTIPLAETAEVVAEEHGVGRGDQDAFAVESQRRAAEAIEAGRFDDEIAPIEVPQRKGDPVRVARDEHPRPGTTAEQLARLRAAFRADGTVTAGNASGINDGAAAVLMTSRAAAEELGLEPMAEVGASAIAGVDPDRMGIGPVPATRKALRRAGLTVEDIDLIELNEAFAAQSLPCISELGLDPDRVNVNGGAIALGHPLGCTGAKLITTLVHEMRRRDASHGLVTMCIGVGQGIALLVHRDAETT